MDMVNVHDAKTHLSRLLDRVEQGEQILLARNGKPVAQLVSPRGQPRRPGSLEGTIKISDDFDAPLPPEVADAFGMNDRTPS
jgi:prevent-host-death family protein